MASAHVSTLAAVTKHHSSNGGQVASSVFIVVVLILVIYIMHLHNRQHLHRVGLVILGAFLISMQGTIPDWLRAAVNFIEQVPYYIGSWF